jgi:hypothetical protein
VILQREQNESATPSSPGKDVSYLVRSFFLSVELKDFFHDKPVDRPETKRRTACKHGHEFAELDPAVLIVVQGGNVSEEGDSIIGSALLT